MAQAQLCDPVALEVKRLVAFDSGTAIKATGKFTGANKDWPVFLIKVEAYFTSCPTVLQVLAGQTIVGSPIRDLVLNVLWQYLGSSLTGNALQRMKTIPQPRSDLLWAALQAKYQPKTRSALRRMKTSFFRLRQHKNEGIEAAGGRREEHAQCGWN